MPPSPPARTSGAPVEPRRVVPRQRTAVLVSVFAAIVAALFLGFAALTALPPALANLASEDADGRTPVTIESDDLRSQIVAPVGWVVVHESAASVIVRTPDGAMSARIDLVDKDPSAVVSAEPGLATSLRTETLTSGLTVVHADLDEGGVVAAVALGGDGSAPSARVVATTVEGTDMAVYRPALAQLLDGIAP